VFLIILNISRKHKNEQTLEINVEEYQNEDLANENVIAMLQNMKERDRMEYYFNEFLNYIETENYEKAYNVLYDDFKENYFPTLKDFEEYIPTIFSDMVTIKHTNFERNGEVYVLWISLNDAINGKPGEEKEMNIVIKEEDYNNFVLSFSVI